MTRPPIHQRFGPAPSAFLRGILDTLLAKRFPAIASDLAAGRQIQFCAAKESWH
ncbi:MAG: hypothetical protein R3F31_28350 [Verrucomicrobiales bacterium]